jgi:hypothetical protein
LRKRVLDLAWPIISGNLLETLLGVVDTKQCLQSGHRRVGGREYGQHDCIFSSAVVSMSRTRLLATALRISAL